MIDVKSQKILIVENEYSLNSLIAIKLKEAGFYSQSVYSGAEAKLFIKSNPDFFAILDYGLDDINCSQLIFELLKENIKFPFIIITGNNDQELVVKMMQLGAYDYIIKEVGFTNYLPSLLLKSIERYLSKKKLEDYQNEIIKNEEQFRNIFNNIQDIYIIISKDFIIEEISPSVKPILGLEKEEITNRYVSELYVLSSDWKKHYHQLLNTGNLKNAEALIRTNPTMATKTCLINAKKVFFNSVEQFKIIATVRDISEYKKLENELITKTIKAEEHERKRIAESLHDDLGPLLSAAKIYINLLKNDDKTIAERSELTNSISEIIDESIKNMRVAVNALMPTTLSDYGLEKAFQSFINKLTLNVKTNIIFSCKLNQDRFGEVIESTIYRSGIELINNGIKHSSASKIELIVEQIDDNLWLKYSDNGIGFNYNEQQQPDKAHGHGLANLINRIKSLHGKIHLKSSPEKGTSVQILFVLSNMYDL